MTLNNWVNSGGAMLSNRCALLCCQEIGCNEEQLREMHIHDIKERFWDRGLGEIGEALTKASQKYNEIFLYIGDDNLIYC